MTTGLTFYTTCPTGVDLGPADYRRQLIDVARWTEQAGCRGALVYNDNFLPDPWSVADVAVAHTETFVPMVAVQPVYQHPFATARAIATMARLHGRGADLNLVTGGFHNHLLALGDTVDHDDRYERLVEFAGAVHDLLYKPVVTRHGRFYALDRAQLSIRPPTSMLPRIFMAGSSPAAAHAAAATDAIALGYPPEPLPGIVNFRGHQGIRLGIIARDTAGSAWRQAHKRFPPDRAGTELHDYAAARTQSTWHRQLSAATSAGPVYWLHPFHTYKTFCPYLVGSHAEVAEALRWYLDGGVTTVVLDVPPDPDDLGEAIVALSSAAASPRPAKEAL